ncbi:hypothetical protein QJS10_CPB17g00972 [Acorus calamus]|uniref:Uncharacterized protein n=1 Tax=Acorus calamus TaxID=4465 RepID=A0AAV9CSP0_ACOCL|nr:hypothetical protein QJS10_CPB17g00972 [Acorus calamus]
MERNASSDAEIGRLWKFDGYHDSLGKIGVGRFVIWPHKNMFIVPGCLVFSFKEYIKTSLGDQVKDKKESKTKLYRVEEMDYVEMEEERVKKIKVFRFDMKKE